MIINGPTVWQTRCGARGVYTKYQEAFRVLGNQGRLTYLDHRYSEVKDMSYISNAFEVSMALIGLYEQDNKN